MKPPIAPNDDNPKRRSLAPVLTRLPELHERSDSFKEALLEGLLAIGDIHETKLLYAKRLEARRFIWFGKLRFYGYAVGIEIPGGWVIEARGENLRQAVLAALNTPAPFPVNKVTKHFMRQNRPSK